MCDRGGEIFSERAEGWGTFQGTTMRRDDRTGRPVAVTETLDLCPNCNGQGAAAPVAVAAIPGVPEAERLADIHRGAPATTLTDTEASRGR